MTTTAERAELLAEHCKQLSSEQYLGIFTTQDLLEWVTLELGNIHILDKFVSYGNDKRSMALPNGPILHILSGNTPHAGLQSILRGLLIGAVNLVKLPSDGLPEVSSWIAALPDELASLVSVVEELDDKKFSSASTIIAIGSDGTMSEVQKRITSKQKFIPHGHKLSIGLVEKPCKKTAKLVVQDACAFNQQGCLSLHTVYVMENAQDFLPMVAEAMRSYEVEHPRGNIAISESGAISNLREAVRYEAANDPENVSIEHSQGNTAWTAIYRNSPTLYPSVLNRVISIQPWPKKAAMLGTELEFISTLALEESMIEHVQHLDIPRICKLGQSQLPSLTWHHDGLAPLSALIRWRDIDL